MFALCKKEIFGETHEIHDFSHLLCTVKPEKEDARQPTNYLYVWTFAFCLFQFEKRKRTKNMFNDFESCVVRFVVTISITISVSFFFFFLKLTLFLSSTFLIILQYI